MMGRTREYLTKLEMQNSQKKNDRKHFKLIVDSKTRLNYLQNLQNVSTFPQNNSINFVLLILFHLNVMCFKFLYYRSFNFQFCFYASFETNKETFLASTLCPYFFL
jgi:hypothetical protein